MVLGEQRFGRAGYSQHAAHNAAGPLAGHTRLGMPIASGRLLAPSQRWQWRGSAASLMVLVREVN